MFGVLKFRCAFSFFGTGCWDGRAYFEPLEKTVNVYITGGKSKSFEVEHKFYRQIEIICPEIAEETLDILPDAILDYAENSPRDDTRSKILAI